ncbi:hypothetical protein [Kineosporia sp. R_H_3]|uniref:hypothetical protein n=1 Tax=Kineosporia sp. R_H_3 TaxID=1961848 RepID=UPI000B4B0268|nr:hypothetical protein [Kineosporia sp. R_H_3]
MPTILPPPSAEVARFAAFRECLHIRHTPDGVTIELAGPAVDDLPADLRAEMLEAAGDVVFLALASHGVPVTSIEFGAAA